MNKKVTNPMNDATHTMFCRQCQETFGNSSCTKVGVCGIGSIENDVKAILA